MKTALIFLLLILATVSCFAKTFSSPDKQYEVKIVRETMPGADPEDLFTLILKDRKKTITKIPTSGYLLGAKWSPDRNYVAVNNRIGNSGDYLWVFSLPEGKVLKRPDDQTATQWWKASSLAIQEQNPRATDENFNRAWLTGKEWDAKGRLIVKVHTLFYSEGGFSYFLTVDVKDEFRILDRQIKKMAD